MIYPLTEDMLDTVMNLWLSANCSAHDFISPSYWEGHFEEVRQLLPDALVYVFKDEGVIKGFYGLTDGYIAGIFVGDEWQGQGIGSQLLAHAKTMASPLSLDVYEKNIKAVGFYKAHGFEMKETSKDSDTGETECHMEWQEEEH